MLLPAPLFPHYEIDGEPIRCRYCWSGDIVEHVVAIEAGYTSEQEYKCKKCGEIVGFWAYGGFDPSFFAPLQIS